MVMRINRTLTIGGSARLLCVVLALSLALFCAVAEAKGGGGGGRSSGGGSRSSGYSNSSRSSAPASKPSGSYSNSGKPRAPSAATPAPKSDYSNSGKSSADTAAPKGSTTSTVPKPSTAAPKQSAFQQKTDSAASKAQAAKSLEQYKTERGKFKVQDNPVYTSQPTQTAVMGRIGAPDWTSYDNSRRSFWGANPYSPPPYIYQSRPSFGMWDALALWFILDHFSNPHYSAMYYNHSDDPAMLEWRKEAERLAQDNADLKTKLAGLDAQVATMQGKPKDPAYVPDDMKAAVVAPDAASKLLPGAQPAKSSSEFPWVLGGIVVIALGGGGFWLYRRNMGR
jgi:hypothetical protein